MEETVLNAKYNNLEHYLLERKKCELQKKPVNDFDPPQNVADNGEHV